MIVGYNFFLKRIASMLESKENITMNTIADRLSLRQDEFRDILNIMEKRGDIEVLAQAPLACNGKCGGCGGSCSADPLPSGQKSVRYYRLTEKGRAVCNTLL